MGEAERAWSRAERQARPSLLGGVLNLILIPPSPWPQEAPEDRQALSATAFRIPVESRSPHSLDQSAHPVIDQEYDWPLHQAGPGVAPLDGTVYHHTYLDDLRTVHGTGK